MGEVRGQKVLVAESDRTVLELLQIRLDVAGYHACVARTGHAALDLMRHLRPAVMIIDLNLDEGQGLQLVRQVRARHPELVAPILVTGRGLTVEVVKQALSLGAQSCLAKPFSGADALERIGRLLRAPVRGAAAAMAPMAVPPQAPPSTSVGDELFL